MNDAETGELEWKKIQPQLVSENATYKLLHPNEDILKDLLNELIQKKPSLEEDAESFLKASESDEHSPSVPSPGGTGDIATLEGAASHRPTLIAPQNLSVGGGGGTPSTSPHVGGGNDTISPIPSDSGGTASEADGELSAHLADLAGLEAVEAELEETNSTPTPTSTPTPSYSY